MKIQYSTIFWLTLISNTIAIISRSNNDNYIWKFEIKKLLFLAKTIEINWKRKWMNYKYALVYTYLGCTKVNI